MFGMIFIIILSFCFLNVAIAQQRMITLDGDRVLGVVLSENESEIIIKSFSNKIITIPVSSLKSRDTLNISIKTKTGSEVEGSIANFNNEGLDLISKDNLKISVKFDGIENIYINDSELLNIFDSKMFIFSQIDSTSNSYQKFGIGIGYPSGLHFVYGFTNNLLTFHLSAGFSMMSVGYQGGFGYNLLSRGKKEFNILLIYANYYHSNFINKETNKDETVYLVWDMNLSSLHLQAGLGLSSSRNFSFTIQLGYAYRWGN